MEFSPDDFKRMMFNVYEASPDLDFTETFPELRLYDAFKKNLTVDGLTKPVDKNKIIRYIAYVYDKNSPYRIKYKETGQRKVVAILDAGFELQGNTFPEYIEDILYDRNHKVVDMVVAFLQLHYDTTYRHLVLLETMYEKKLKEVLLGGGKDKVSELDAIRASIEATKKELLQEEQNRGLVKSLYKAINSDKLEMAPEDIALKLKNQGLAQTVSDL